MGTARCAVEAQANRTGLADLYLCHKTSAYWDW